MVLPPELLLLILIQRQILIVGIGIDGPGNKLVIVFLFGIDLRLLEIVLDIIELVDPLLIGHAGHNLADILLHLLLILGQEIMYQLTPHLIGQQ